MSKQVKRCDSYGYDGMSAMMKEDAHGEWVRGEDYDALHAEAEALRLQNAMLVTAASNINSDREALRAENEKRQRRADSARGMIRYPCKMWDGEEAESQEYAKGYNMALEHVKKLNATPAPEVPDHLREAAKMAEQGERQEAVAHRLINDLGEVMTDWHDGPPPDNFVDLCGQAVKDVRVELAFSTPQPGPDVRALAAFALELIYGAWEGGSFDGGDIQEAGVRHGLLTVEQRQESCGEHCDCAEYGFPSECYRLTPAIAAHRQAQQGDSNDT
jgi:hypothetical protein